ncbi:NADPH:quinone reductase-like Zn-dependent oxidoreductase [Acinetobacter calcoaceticus]|uniref:NADPH:quinone reductase-like Zn-dependent oxidoreductase n=1 Tax=Acinetobacter calcoaceticus TaxID=471 RepID=A0A4R1XRE7_ACICA|nr:NADPH:quinone reductase-like Zn-dependent oxidoreductase [Acinetobacter calcoaceticus]
MKAIYIEHYGNIDAVQLGIQPMPMLEADDVLVLVSAASVNPLDLKLLSGDLKMISAVKFPFILGSDLAGTVVKIGAEVTQFKLGDEVYAKTDQSGAFAEYSVVKQSNLARKPKNISMQQAASLPLVSLTAWQALFEVAQLRANQKVLIHAGSGGVGSIAIQMAKACGAFVATTTSQNNMGWVKALGADWVIDYQQSQFDALIQDYDVVFDTQGGETLEKSFKVLKKGGIIVSIAGPPDANVVRNLPVNWLLKQLIPLMSYSVRRKAKRHAIRYAFLMMQPNGQQLKDISQWVESFKIKAVIDKVYRFEQIKAALSYVAIGHVQGKVVIEINSKAE